ncbi:MAG: hypothetical protein HY939_04375 [Gammaproteobacteria bacterium]|nr:hypothetical protein [Gammaproteobacteria bacterium]
MLPYSPSSRKRLFNEEATTPEARRTEVGSFELPGVSALAQLTPLNNAILPFTLPRISDLASSSEGARPIPFTPLGMETTTPFTPARFRSIGTQVDTEELIQASIYQAYKILSPFEEFSLRLKNLGYIDKQIKEILPSSSKFHPLPENFEETHRALIRVNFSHELIKEIYTKHNRTRNKEIRDKILALLVTEGNLLISFGFKQDALAMLICQNIKQALFHLEELIKYIKQPIRHHLDCDIILGLIQSMEGRNKLEALIRYFRAYPLGNPSRPPFSRAEFSEFAIRSSLETLEALLHHGPDLKKLGYKTAELLQLTAYYNAETKMILAKQLNPLFQKAKISRETIIRVLNNIEICTKLKLWSLSEMPIQSRNMHDFLQLCELPQASLWRTHLPTQTQVNIPSVPATLPPAPPPVATTSTAGEEYLDHSNPASSPPIAHHLDHTGRENGNSSPPSTPDRAPSLSSFYRFFTPETAPHGSETGQILNNDGVSL